MSSSGRRPNCGRSCLGRQTARPGLDPMERLRAVGDAIGRSVTGGHWPGQGPTDQRLTQIADNLSRAWHLIEAYGPSQQASAERSATAQREASCGIWETADDII
jgi:hypothetical protein